MATDHQRARARGRPPRARVVLKGKKQHEQQATLSVDDGAGIKTTVSDTEFKPSAVLSIGKPLSDHHTAAWGSAPLINDDDIIDSDTHSLRDEGDKIRRMHSTPASRTSEGVSHNALQPITVLQSPESSIVNISTPESSSEEEERERRAETCDSHSDDVFLGNNRMARGKLSQSDSKVAYSRCPEDDSKLKIENDQLPPLPPSKKQHRRPYTSPGRNSSSGSTDSYTSPIRNRTLLLSITDGGMGGQCSTVRRKPPQRSKKAAKKGGGKRDIRIHPEDNRPPNLEIVPSPRLHSTTSTLKNSTLSSSMGMEKRTLSSTDSMSSTFSSTLTPLLTSSLRKGGESQPGSAAAWGFDADAQLESCFPDRHMQVLVATWNMQQQKVKY